MAKKTKKRSVKRAVAKSKKLVSSTKNKINLAVKNIVIFLALSLVSFYLYKVSVDELYVTLFSFASMLFGFVALAFLIALLALLFLKLMKK